MNVERLLAAARSSERVTTLAGDDVKRGAANYFKAYAVVERTTEGNSDFELRRHAYNYSREVLGPKPVPDEYARGVDVAMEVVEELQRSA